MENNKAFTLINDGKAFFSYYHQRFLPTDHKKIKNINDSLLVELKGMSHR